VIWVVVTSLGKVQFYLVIPFIAGKLLANCIVCVSDSTGSLCGGDLLTEWMVVMAGDDVAEGVCVYSGASEMVVSGVNGFCITTCFDDC
jgi:hypothetical protein